MVLVIPVIIHGPLHMLLLATNYDCMGRPKYTSPWQCNINRTKRLLSSPLKVFCQRGGTSRVRQSMPLVRLHAFRPREALMWTPRCFPALSARKGPSPSVIRTTAERSLTFATLNFGSWAINHWQGFQPPAPTKERDVLHLFQPPRLVSR